MDTKKQQLPIIPTDIEISISNKKLTDKEAYYLEMDLFEFMQKKGYNASVNVKHQYRECPACKYGEPDHATRKKRAGVYTGKDGAIFNCGGR